MDATSIELPGSRIAHVIVDDDQVRVRFEPALLIKSMTGSVERTRWEQNGDLVFTGAVVEGALPDLPAECAGGDVGENIYTYRDMVPVPLESRGRAHAILNTAAGTIAVSGNAVRLELEGVPKYLEHIRPE